jgi:hypothetical protein
VHLLPGVVIVEDYLDNLILRENELVGVSTVDCRFSGVLTSRENRVECGYFGGDVGHVVEEGAMNGLDMTFNMFIAQSSHCPNTH